MKAFNTGMIDNALKMMGDIMAREKSEPFRIVVCGGAALISCALVSRTTNDIDIVALMDANACLISPDPLPETLLIVARKVQENLGLADRWLNNGPSRNPGGLFQVGLPQGFVDRLTRRDYGPCLAVFFAGRFDQIHFKVFAAVDAGPGRHVDDLLALKPTPEEMEAAARWSIKHDPSQGFKTILLSMLRKLGYANVADKLQ